MKQGTEITRNSEPGNESSSEIILAQIFNEEWERRNNNKKCTNGTKLEKWLSITGSNQSADAASACKLCFNACRSLCSL